MNVPLTAAIIGVTGYVGSELARLIGPHSYLSLEAVYSRSAAGQALDEVVPPLAGFTSLVVRDLT